MWKSCEFFGSEKLGIKELLTRGGKRAEKLAAFPGLGFLARQSACRGGHGTLATLRCGTTTIPHQAGLNRLLRDLLEARSSS
jgi:hypothetical protein